MLVVLPRGAGVPAATLTLLGLQPAARFGKPGVIARYAGLIQDVYGEGSAIGIWLGGLFLAVRAFPVVVAKLRQDPSAVFPLGCE